LQFINDLVLSVTPINNSDICNNSFPSQKFDISFINLHTYIILQNLKQTLRCTNHKSIQQTYMRKYYKTSKHPNKINILKKYEKNQHFKIELRKG
jgi:hypothetical protein